jgi:hypothetical protein
MLQRVRKEVNVGEKGKGGKRVRTKGGKRDKC